MLPECRAASRRRTWGEQRAKSDSESTRSSSIFRLSNFWLVTPGHFHQDSYPLWIYENVPKIVFQEGLLRCVAINYQSQSIQDSKEIKRRLFPWEKRGMKEGSISAPFICMQF